MTEANVVPSLDQWGLIEAALGDLCTAWTRGHLVPLLEADIVAYFYHLLVSRADGNANGLHLATRIFDADEKSKNKKPDLAIGPVVTTDQQKIVFLDFLESKGKSSAQLQKARHSKFLDGLFRPAVAAPSIILEFKVLLVSASVSAIKRDIQKLGWFSRSVPEGRALVVFHHSRLKDATRHKVIDCWEQANDPVLRLYMCHRREPEPASWTLLCGTPTSVQNAVKS